MTGITKHKRAISVAPDESAYRCPEWIPIAACEIQQTCDGLSGHRCMIRKDSLAVAQVAEQESYRASHLKSGMAEGKWDRGQLPS
jgi:hypothetical protein